MIKTRFIPNFHERSKSFKIWDKYLYCYYKYDDLNFENDVDCQNYIDNITDTYTTFYERKNGDTFVSEKQYKDLKNFKGLYKK